MAGNTFNDILDRCVNMLRAGVSIDDAVAAYPTHAPALRERLAVAQALSFANPGQQANAAVFARARSRFLAAVRERTQGEPAPATASSVFGFLTRGVRRLVLVPYALPAVAAMVLLGGAAAGIAAGTGNSNPRAWFAGSSSNHEMKLEGTLVSIDATAITITTGSGDVTAQLTPQTELKDDNGAPLAITDFAAGDFVKIRASFDVDGTLVAREVEREAPDDGEQPPAATETDNSDSGPGSTDDDGDDDSAGPGSAEDAADDSSGPGPADDNDDAASPDSDEIDDDHESADGHTTPPVLSSEPIDEGEESDPADDGHPGDHSDETEPADDDAKPDVP
jgi:hypothetical protein